MLFNKFYILLVVVMFFTACTSVMDTTAPPPETATPNYIKPRLDTITVENIKPCGVFTRTFTFDTLTEHQAIRIADRLTPEERKFVLLHEAVHALVYANTINPEAFAYHNWYKSFESKHCYIEPLNGDLDELLADRVANNYLLFCPSLNLPEWLPIGSKIDPEVIDWECLNRMFLYKLKKPL